MSPLSSVLPDEPRWVQARAMLATGAAWTRGRVIGHDPSRLAVALPGATVTEIDAALPGRAGWTVLVPGGGGAPAGGAPAAADDGDRLARELAAAGWAVEPAALYTVAGAGLPDELPDDDGATVLADRGARDAALAAIDPALRDELGRADGPLVAAFVDGAAAAFAHAPWRTARHFELAADTLPAFRQLGLATRVAAGLIRLEHAAGRAPVLGALDVSAPAQRLAARLGLVPTVRMHVAWPPE